MPNRLKVALLVCLTAAVQVAVILLILPKFIGCQNPKPTYKIVEPSDVSAPVFNFRVKQFWFDRGGEVLDNPAAIDELDLWEIDRSGNNLKELWKVRPSPSANFCPDVVQYGTIPTGWKELKRAEPLKRSSLYRMCDMIFAIRENGSFVMLPGRHLKKQDIVSSLRKIHFAAAHEPDN